jgi:flagellar protein FliO/FliZ
MGNNVIEKNGRITMRLATWTTVLMLLTACPAVLPAQTTPNPPETETSVESRSSSSALKLGNATNRVESDKNRDAGPSFLTLVGGLLLVLALFFAAAWAFRRMLPPGAGPLPSEVFEMLGGAPLAGRQQAHLLRCGNKLLLVSTGVAGVTPLTEITDPAEVERLTNLCRQSRPAATALRRVFQKGESHD